VETYHGGTVQVALAEGKGRVLVAARALDPGERALLEYPLVEVAADDTVAAYALLVRLREEGSLEFAPLFYWAALCTLTAAEVAGALCPAWPSVPAQTQAHALELHAPEEACRSASSSTAAVLAALWPPGAGPDPSRLERLLQVWIYNSFDQGAGDDALEAGVIYLAASMLSHSCAPNAAWHQDDANSFILQARGPIADGEEITIPYLGPTDLCLPTPDRRRILSATKAFVCGCDRCAAPLDAARAFRCPRCASGTALAASDERGAEQEPGRLECGTCGCLTKAEAEPLLTAEAALKAWARALPEFHAEGEAEAEAEASAASALERLRQAEAAGIGEAHWAVDAARRAAAAEEGPELACELLRRSVEVRKSVGVQAQAARLRLALASALCRCGGAEALREASQVYGEAADMLAILFGDDHPEHREAAALRDKAARRQKQELLSAASVVSVKKEAAAAESSSNRKGQAPGKRRQRR